MKRSLRRTLCAITLSLALGMSLAAGLPAAARWGRSADLPAAEAFSKWSGSGKSIAFSAEDFTGRVTGDETLSAIVVKTLPQSGALLLAGEPIRAGQAVETEQLGTVSYIPGAAEEHTSFTFLPVFSRSGAGDESVTVSLNASDTPNSAPIAVDLSYETFTELELCAALKAVDPEGDDCTFELVSRPKRGTVEITETGFSYLPGSRAGRDRFTYAAVDSYGNRSQPATVEIRVVARAGRDAFDYTDMQGNPAHYAALRLASAGVFVGERLGSEHFFDPDAPVTRTEFLALTAAVADLPLPTAAVSTGLSDNESIPVWAQSYVAAGLLSGVVQGIHDGRGNRVFAGEEAITRGEAAVILDRALSLPADGREAAYADGDALPSWARQSVINAASAGVLPVFSDGSVRVSETVTRGDAAMMLYAALGYAGGK